MENAYTRASEAEWDAREKNGQERYHAVSPSDMFFHYATDHLEKIRDEAKDDRMARGVVQFCLDRDRVKASETWGRDCSYYSKGIYDHKLIEQFISAGDIDKGLPALHLATAPIPDDEPVLFAACDQGYFNKFGKVFLASLAKKSPDTWVHFHIYNAPDLNEILDVLHKLHPKKTGLSSERFKVSENVPLKQRGHLQVTYYHMARFIRLWKFQRYRKAPVWLSDVDVLVNNDLTPLMKTLREDVALRLRPGRIEPWNQVSACLVGINTTKAGLEFLNGIAAYVKYALENARHSFWGADQQAMYSVMAHLVDEEHLWVRGLMDNETSLSHDDDAYTWATAGVKKHKQYTDGDGTKYSNAVQAYMVELRS